MLAPVIGEPIAGRISRTVLLTPPISNLVNVCESRLSIARRSDASVFRAHIATLTTEFSAKSLTSAGLKDSVFN